MNIKYVEKRDGIIESFDIRKIKNAILKSTNDIVKIEEDYLESMIDSIMKSIEAEMNEKEINKICVEDIQDIVVANLKHANRELYNNYTTHRKNREKERMRKSSLMKSINAIAIETDRDNANVGNNFSSKLLRIASESNKTAVLSKMPKEMAKEHENGDVYFHDLDSFNLTVNCLHVPLDKLFKNTFNTGYGTIRTPKSITSAAELLCIILQSSQNDCFGGQSIDQLEKYLAPYVQITRDKIDKDVRSLVKELYSEEEIIKLVESRVRIQVRQAMQGIVYNLNTMHSRAGSQVPFSSINIGIPEGTEQEKKDGKLLCMTFLEEYNKGLGKGESCIFPNIIYRVKDGVNKKPGDPYFETFKLACKVAAKRMNPTFMNLDADFNKEYYDKGYLPATMGCRTYLMSNINGEPGVEGRGNIAPATINLPRLGIRANHNIDKFFKLLDEKLEVAKNNLLYRYNVLKELRIKDLPFVAGQKLMRGSENLNENDSIEPILKQGTWGIGFIGLAETLIALTGYHHGESIESKELGEKIINHIRNYTNNLTQETKLNWSCYATPAEGLSGKFILQDKERFGTIPGVTDKNYYTNSFHIPVGYPISISRKVSIEAPYHKLCNGGHISYIELDNYPTGNDIMNIVTKSYNNTNISYIGVNFHIKYCKDCGTYLQDSDEVCSCGSDNIQGISRVTGYLSLDERFGPGKYYERKDRISHNNNTYINNYTIK